MRTFGSSNRPFCLGGAQERAQRAKVADNAFLPVFDPAGTVLAETLSGGDMFRLIAGITIDCSFADEVENKRFDASSNAAQAFMSGRSSPSTSGSPRVRDYQSSASICCALCGSK